MRKIGSFIIREFKAVLPPWLFFFFAFLLLGETQWLMLARYGIHTGSLSVIVVGTLLLAKVFLIVDSFRFVDKYRSKSVIQSALWKTWIYWIAALVLRCLEAFLKPVIHGFSMATGAHELVRNLREPRFWIVQTWLLVLLLMFFVAREMIWALGRERFDKIFFGRPLKKARGSS